MEQGLADSRAKAQALVLAGRVKIEGDLGRKPGEMVLVDKRLSLLPGARYVSRGGEKLNGALEDFDLSPAGLVCLDIGASTGGFTDCLLQNGAQMVFAVDVGTHQLADSLKKDPRVVSIERTHIKDLDPSRLIPQPSFCVVDVSFISLKNVLPFVKRIMPTKSGVIALVKPQFEVGPKFLKKGVVRSAETVQTAVRSIREFSEKAGFLCLREAASRLKGPKGNQEIFLQLMVVSK